MINAYIKLLNLSPNSTIFHNEYSKLKVIWLRIIGLQAITQLYDRLHFNN